MTPTASSASPSTPSTPPFSPMRRKRPCEPSSSRSSPAYARSWVCHRLRRDAALPKRAAARSTRLRRRPQVGLDRLVPWEPLRGLVIGDGGGDDHILALLPVGRRRDLVCRGQLQG